jgi:hypothetical protein
MGGVLIWLLATILVVFHPLLKLLPQVIDTCARSSSPDVVVQVAAGSGLAFYVPNVHIGIASLPIRPMNFVSEAIPVSSLRFYDDIGCSTGEIVGNLWRDPWYDKLIIDRAACRFTRIAKLGHYPAMDRGPI